MQYVDLFCGIGAFHAALNDLGHQCIFACDLNNAAADVYELNWGRPGGHRVCNDFRDVVDKIPPMDIICAGLPCQPFSKSGGQMGFMDQTRGTLWYDVFGLVETHKPKILFFENVPNMVNIDNGNTFSVISKIINELGYSMWYKTINSVHFGIPQNRPKLFIVAIRKELLNEREFVFPVGQYNKDEVDLNTILEPDTTDEFDLTEEEIFYLEAWNDFLQNVNTKTKLPGHPIWFDWFEGGNTNQRIWDEWKLNGKTLDDLAKWRLDFIQKNSQLYLENKKFIDIWSKKWSVENFPKSHRKFEWQAGPESRSIWENLIQFRPSGIRVKRPTYTPGLVGIGQVPIVGWLKRRLTIRERARLQSLPDDFIIDRKHGNNWDRMLGNSINVKVVYEIMQEIESTINS